MKERFSLEALSGLPLETTDKVIVASYIDRLNSIVGNLDQGDYQQLLAHFKQEVEGLSPDKRAAFLLAAETLVRGWVHHSGKETHPGKKQISTMIRDRAAELTLWLRLMRKDQGAF